MKVANQNIDNLSKKAFFQYQKIFPVFKKEKNKQYGILSLTFITLALFGIFALNPTITTIIELRKTLEDARFVESRLSEKIQNMQSLRVEYDSLGPDLTLIENAVPKGPEATRFVGQIQAIAESSGVTMKGLTIGAIALSGSVAVDNPETASIVENAVNKEYGLKPFVFSITVSGTYAQVREFLNVLSSFERIVSIDSIGISRESGTSTQVGMSVQGTTYFKQ